MKEKDIFTEVPIITFLILKKIKINIKKQKYSNFLKNHLNF